MRSAYRMLSSTKERREAWLEETPASSDVRGLEKSWTSLWRIKVPSKLKTFLWRLAKHSLPTSDVLHHRHIASVSTCSICGAEDSWRHSLLDCTMARCVWALADEEMTEHMSQVQEPEARNWLFTMFDTLPQDQLTRMCVTLWALWHARRKAIHEGVFQSPLSTHCFVDSFISELTQLKKSEAGDRQRGVGAPSRPVWIPPPVGIAKINVDAGVARKHQRGAVAAVARDGQGGYLGASAVLFDGLADPEVLEAMAIREGVNLAQDLLLTRIKVASDCLTVVEAMKEPNLGRYSHILHEITSTAKGFADATFVHEHRSSNKEPHDLAQSVLGSPVGRYVWFAEPPIGVCIPKALSI